MKEIVGKSVLLLGYGREGQSTHDFLRVRYPDVIVGIADKDESVIVPNVEGGGLHTGHDYLKSIFSYDVIVRSPGIPPYLPEFSKAHEEGKWITSATNIFFSECPGMVIGVTGTKGKSTTTSLIYEILRREYPDVRLVGNIGRPALGYLTDADNKTIFVAELSSHQLVDSRYSPHVSVLLNIVPEHLDYYPSVGEYIKAKGQIIDHQNKKDIVVFNPTHKVLAKLVDKAKSQKVRFAINPDNDLFCWIEDGTVYAKSGVETPARVMFIKDFSLLGKGNLENTLAAISVGLILGVSKQKIRRAVKEFIPLEHRLEFVGEVGGIRFYNDSLATIPEATIHAIEALGQKVETLIAGGFDRGLKYDQLGNFISKRTRIKNLILFPDTGNKIWEAVIHLARTKPISIKKYNVRTMKEAVDIAFRVTTPGMICLMSPASASFNLFKDYRERGETFKKLVLSRTI